MDWSATLSLTTSHTRTHRANYGSFSAADAAPLKRHGSGSTISIPESIPEHQCVERFASPHLNYAAVLERFDVLGIASAASSISSAVSSGSGGYASISSSKTLTITETASADVTRLQTFKMMLTSPSAARINGGPPAGAASEDPFAPHDPHDPHGGASAGVASSYWLQERERMRLLRDKRHRTRNGSPTKAATLRDDDDPEVSKYRTAALMCSVPLLLVIAFVVFVLVFGDGSAAVAAEASGVAVLAASNAAAAPAAPSSHLRTGDGQPPPPALAHLRNP